VYASAQTVRLAPCSNNIAWKQSENHMYIGGGILGTILVIVLIVYLVRRI
jgi:hypothetical protein